MLARLRGQGRSSCSIDDAEAFDDVDGAIAGLLAPGPTCTSSPPAAPTRCARSTATGRRQVRRSKTGVLLRPDIDLDGDLLGVTLPRRAPVQMVVGRGYLRTTASSTSSRSRCPITVGCLTAQANEVQMQSALPRNHWLGIEFRHLAALAAIAEEGSFRAAAERLGYVQSAVSQQIAFLERTLDVRLIERAPGNHPVSLTDAGRIVLGHFKAILVKLDAAWADVDALSRGRAGAVRVAAAANLEVPIVPEILRGSRTIRRSTCA